MWAAMGRRMPLSSNSPTASTVTASLTAISTRGLIGFGIGIAHGYATLGTIGFEGRHDYAAIGTVSNVASRLCDEAKPDGIAHFQRHHRAHG